MISESAFNELLDHYFDLRNRVAQLERDAQRAIKPGRVAAVDPDKGVRLDFGPDENGEPKLSAWLPHPEQGGEATSWVPPTVGQSLLMITPPGSDTRKAFLVRAGYCDEFTAPVRKLNENVFDFEKTRITVREEELRAVSVTVNERGEKVVNIMGVDEVNIQGKNTRIRLHSDDTVLIQARQSIVLHAPSIVSNQTDPGAISDVVPKEEDS